MKLTRPLVLLLFVASLCAEPLAIVQPDTVGLAPDRLARITAAIEHDVAEGNVIGASGLIARRGQIGYFEARGLANREEKTPLRTDSIFRIYSMSKPITSAALMMLHEEGKFSIKDPASKYIPELKGQKVMVESRGFPGDPERGRQVPAKRAITVQDLMRHTAGFTYGYFGGSAVDKMYMDASILGTDQTLADMAKKLMSLPLLYHPGEKFHYSIAVDVQGRLVEALSGERFDKFLSRRIFEPLGMKDTGFWVPKEKQARFSELYTPGKKGQPLAVADPDRSKRYLEPGTFHSGGGGLVSTAEDYLRFCQMFLNGGTFDGQRLLSRKTVELMTRDHLTDIPEAGRRGGGYGFGLGYAVHVDQARSGSAASLGEYNWGGAAGTKFWIDPEEEMIGVYMVQILPHSGLRYGNTFKQLSYQAIAD